MIKQFYFLEFNLVWIIYLCTVQMSSRSIRFVDRILSGVITQGQSRPIRNGNQGVLYVSSSKIGASPSDGFVSYPGHSLG